ncbi:uncharacterized protein LOC143030641 isoform X3 [Oratosquilla oratoria]|uniref:uncharacterized protein LOC143030641 isoform X3 n=1 Tax=Oratosquilla oratoria TaxID=337810 RepID=UPI003F76593B
MTSLQKAVNENFGNMSGLAMAERSDLVATNTMEEDVRATQRENETLIFSDDLPTHHDSPEVDVGPIVEASSMKELQDSTKHMVCNK